MFKPLQKNNSLLFLVVLLILTTRLTAQIQVFWTENFTNGCTSGCFAENYTTGPNGAWNVTATGTTGVNENPFYVSMAEQGSDAGTCSSQNGTNSCLHIGSPTAVSGDIGAKFLNTGLSGTYDIVTDIRAESPVINCTGHTNITLSFNYIEDGDGTNDNATLWYTDGTILTWTQLTDLAKTTTCAANQSTWTNYTVTLPATADNNASVQIGFRWVNNDDGIGTDPSFAVDSILLYTGTASTNTLATGAITGSPFCGCDSVRVPLTSTGTFTSSNVYTVQLSDTADHFANPIVIGTLTDSLNTDTVHCMIPCTTHTGSSYLIRVIASSPAVTGTPSIDTITVDSVIVPVVTISTNETSLLCIDTAVLFTASAIGGGTTPSFQWFLNGASVGANSSTYTTHGTLMNGDSITVTMTSNAACVSPTTASGIVTIDCPQIEIPNVFTPNNDGVNDLFKVNLSGQALQNFNINIYDRWGILIFSSPSVNYKWDGRTTSGQKVNDGTYFYVIDLNGKQYKGTITLIQ